MEMARVMAQAGRVVSVVLLVLVMAAVGVLSIYGLAGSANGPVTMVDPAESFAPVVLSETREELIDRRGPHQRVWRITRQIEVMDRRTKEVSVEEVVSTIVEVGNGLCYQDAVGHWQVSEPTWRATDEGFVLERAGYTLRIGRTIDSWLEYGIEADTVRLRPTAIMASDGTFLQEVGGLDPGAEGRVDPNDPACLVFAGAFGKGIDLELQAAPGGYHQNVIFHEKPPFSEPLDPVTTQILVYTELDLGEDDAAGVLDVAAGKARRQCATEITCTAATDDDVVLVKHVAIGDGLYEYDLCRFADSVVSDRASGGRARRALAAKQLLRDEKTGALYLVESLDHGFFAEAEYPVVWDYQTVNGTLATDTTWYAAYTYYVSDDLTIDHCALRIEPGTFVKVAAGKKITTQNRGTLIARGQPGRRIVFSCASARGNGEEIPGAASGPFAGLEVGDGSALEWCHIYSAATGMTIKGKLAIPFQHSRVIVCGTGIEIATDDPNGCRVFNNIINACTAYGLAANTANGTAAVVNNTFYNNATAIRLGPSCRLDMQILNNLILSCSGVGIDNDSPYYDPNDPSNPSDPNDSVLVLDYNGYHGNTVNTDGVGAGSHDVQTLVSPLCSPSGSSADWVSFYYLNTDPNGGGLLADAGNTEISGWILNDPNLGYEDPNQWSIYMTPEDNVRGFVSATTMDTDTVWQPSYATCDTGTVAIGYHHPRVDYYIRKADVTVNATLEIQPGTVIVQAVDSATSQGRLSIGSTGSLICRGDPFEGGYITFVERGRAGEMAGVGIPWFNERPFVELTSGCAYDVQFTRFVGLGYALVCHEGQGVLRDCQFLLNNRGIDYRSCVGAECANGLFMNNYIAVRDYEGTGGVIRNCTFMTNSRCINLAGSAVADATVYNSLFHSYDYGLRVNNTNCDLTEHYNAFYHENGGTFYPIYPAESHDLDPSDWADPLRDYAQGLYGDPCDPSWPDFDLRFCVVADSNAVDNGYDPAGRGMCGYTVFLANIEDTGVIDIGFHRPLPGDLDSDDLRDFEEYWQGTDPNNPDTDDDGLYDGAEVSTYGTDPLNWDSDDDGLPDGWEVDNGLDPLDGSGLNGWDGDPDGDGHTNGVEYLHGSKANDAQSLPEPTVITVGYGVATIQQAIDNSIHDDLIEVPPGVYNEAVDFKGKRIIISNLSAAYGYWSLVEQTVIDASGLS
ncbi:MAG TPA: hypothetical protein ENN87_14545, partial [Phycisphaerales bacterium]|nr:hypothetical protein [Phycisphaerales bacterium]